MMGIRQCGSAAFAGAAFMIASGVFQGVASGQLAGDLLAARQAEARRIAVIEQASRASCSVFAASGQGGGSGVVISADGLALTNYHVVKPCGMYMHCSMPDGQLYDAVLVGLDPTGDVALIKLLGRDDFPTATLGDSDQVRVGDNCFAVGNPFLLATNFEPTVTWGIVSGVHRYQYPAGTLLEYADCLQTDAAINPGNSGGPLFNDRGELIGINGRASFEKRGRVNVGVGYAISINQIKLFLDHLSSGRIVDHATLGATVGTDQQGRVIVDNILQTSDAYRRGLRYGDEMVSFGGRSIRTVNQFKNVLGIYPKGWRLPLEYRRDGKTTQIEVRLAGVHSAQQLIELVEGRQGDSMPGPRRPPQPDSSKSEKSTIPAAAKKLIEKKSGFANYYFNRIRVSEIWERYAAQGVAGTADQKWRVEARLADQTPVTIVLSQTGSGMQWGEQAAVLDLDLDLSEQVIPLESGGLLPALHLWQRLVTLGPARFGDVYYLGGLPWNGVAGNAHVLTGTFNVVQMQFMFDPVDSQMIGLEMWTDPHRDPCVIHFDNYRSFAGTMFPSVIRVQNGDQFQWELFVDDVTLAQDDP